MACGLHFNDGATTSQALLPELLGCACNFVFFLWMEVHQEEQDRADSDYRFKEWAKRDGSGADSEEGEGGDVGVAAMEAGV